MMDNEKREQWVAASLCLVRGVEPSVEVCKLGVALSTAALSEMALLPPLGVVTDIGRLLLGHPFALSQSRSVGAVGLVDALRGYEEHVLGRLTRDPRFDSLCDAVAALPEALRHQAVGVFVARLLERLGYTGKGVPPGVVRRAFRRPPAELLSRGWATVGEQGEVAAALEHCYQELASLARSTSIALHDAEVFVVENLPRLPSAEQRLAFVHVSDAAEHFGRRLPKKVLRRKRRRGEVITRIDEDTAYPIGGYAEVATVGSIQNLVTSELMYLEDGSDIDLFDVRYASNEHLRYLRDEGIFTRRRRSVKFLLSATLRGSRVKDPGQPWQRTVMALGLTCAITRRLVEWLQEEALRIELVCEDEPPGVIQHERELLTLMLREYIARGVVTVREASSGDSEPCEDTVWLGAGNGSNGCALALDLGEAEPTLRLEDGSVKGWDDITRRLVSTIPTGTRALTAR